MINMQQIIEKVRRQMRMPEDEIERTMENIGKLAYYSSPANMPHFPEPGYFVELFKAMADPMALRIFFGHAGDLLGLGSIYDPALVAESYVKNIKMDGEYKEEAEIFVKEVAPSISEVLSVCRGGINIPYYSALTAYHAGVAATEISQDMVEIAINKKLENALARYWALEAIYQITHPKTLPVQQYIIPMVIEKIGQGSMDFWIDNAKRVLETEKQQEFLSYMRKQICARTEERS